MKAENIIGSVSIVEKTERAYLGIRFETPFDGMFAQVAQALKEMRKWSKENSLADDGPYFLRYYHCDMQSVMDVEVGLLTNSGLAGQERIIGSNRENFSGTWSWRSRLPVIEFI